MNDYFASFDTIQLLVELDGMNYLATNLIDAAKLILLNKMGDKITSPDDKYQWQNVKNQYIAAVAGNFPMN